MYKKSILKISIVAFILALAGFSVSAQKLNLDAPIPMDSHVTKGTLSNGLTYYIRTNGKPEDKVQLRLVVDAGSLLEKDDQQGLAHFMEHMNFNGLKHFPKNKLVNYLQSIGVRFGADLNANTGFNRTFFILPIPTDQSGNLKKGFQILSDWAGGALISTEQVNAERKVILEESRMRSKNAGTRMRKQYFPEMLNKSRYAYRLPIGKDSIVRHADPELIRQYYHDWYRPNLMAVIVVGDITTEKAKSMIKQYFGPLQNPHNEKNRTYYGIKPYTQPQAMVVTDPEADHYNFRLLFPSQKREIEKTLEDYRESMVRGVFSRTLNYLLYKQTQKAQPPYSGAGASLSGAFGGLTLKKKGFMLSLSPIDDFETSIDTAVAVLLRIKRYGFNTSDINNIKKKMLASYERAYKERNKTKSNAFVGEYTRNFMRKEPIPGIAHEYQYVQKMLPTITTQEVSRLANKVLSDHKNFFALITGPQNGDIDLPSDDKLLKIVQQAFKQKVHPVEDNVITTSLLTAAPVPGKILSQSKDAQLGTTTYTLSNGVKVTVKPTHFKDNQIIFNGVKFGGSGQYDVKDKSNVTFLTSLIETMGYGQFTPIQLSNFLSGKTVSLHPNFGGLSDEVSGSSSVNDFRTLLQLNYLKLTAPRKDSGLYNGFLSRLTSRMKNLKSNPQYAFIDSMRTVMYGNNPLTPITIPTEKDLKDIDLSRVMDIYKKEFGNADGFHFFIVGNVDKVDLKPLMKKYLASLPTKGTTPSYKDNGLRKISKDKTFKFYKGTDPKSLILYSIHGNDVKYSEELALKTNLLGQIMTMQINDTIREKMQMIYSGGANAYLSKRPYVHYGVTLQLPCGPDNVDAILKEIKHELKGYEQNGGPKGSLEKAQKATLESHKENLKENNYWIGKLSSIMVWGRSKDSFLNFDQKVKETTKKDMLQTAKKLLDGDKFIAISYPKK